MGSWLELRRNLIVKHVQVLKDDDMVIKKLWEEKIMKYMRKNSFVVCLVISAIL